MAAVNIFSQTSPNFDIQGHRGARGLAPENTIPAFLKALDLGVDTLELDTVVSKDGKLVVSHEPWFSSEISLDTNGQPILPENQKEFNLYKINYAEIKLFDVGSLGNRRFPVQQKIKGFQPDVYSPHFSLVNEFTVKYCCGKKITIVPWTVNETAAMENLKKFQLDGIITDYPNRAIDIFRK